MTLEVYSLEKHDYSSIRDKNGNNNTRNVNTYNKILKL